jgi:hypothetical protein
VVGVLAGEKGEAGDGEAFEAWKAVEDIVLSQYVRWNAMNVSRNTKGFKSSWAHSLRNGVTLSVVSLPGYFARV